MSLFTVPRNHDRAVGSYNIPCKVTIRALCTSMSRYILAISKERERFHYSLFEK